MTAMCKITQAHKEKNVLWKKGIEESICWAFPHVISCKHQNSPIGVPRFIYENTNLDSQQSSNPLYLGIRRASLENVTGTSQWSLFTDDMRWCKRLQLNH